MMKRTLRLVTLLLLLFMGMACGSNAAKSKLKKEANVIASKCPVPYQGMPVTLTDAKYDPQANIFTLFYDFDVPLRSMSAKSSAYDAQREMFLSTLQDVELMPVITAAGADVLFSLVSKVDGERLEYRVTNDELQQIVAHPKSEKERYMDQLQGQVRLVNAYAPSPMGEGLELTQADMADGYITYTTMVDESVVDMTSLAADQGGMKKSITDSLLASGRSNESALQFLKALAANDMGLVYRYIGAASSQEIDITVSPDEIRAMLP